MKTLVITSMIAALAMIGAAPKAEARPYRGYPSTTIVVTGYTSWGAPIRAERYFVRYAPCGSVVWGYRRLPVVRPYCPPPRAYCPPPYAHRRHHHHAPVRYRDRGCR